MNNIRPSCSQIHEAANYAFIQVTKWGKAANLASKTLFLEDGVITVENNGFFP